MSQYNSRYEYWRHVQIPDKLLFSIAERVHAANKELIISPFSEFALQKAIAIGADKIKIASGEVFNTSLFKSIMSSKLPVIVSTGLSSKSEIKEISDLLIHNQTDQRKHILLHCVTKYPTPDNEAALLEIKKLQLNCPELGIGLSDHSGSLFPSFYALSHDVAMIEFHVTFDRNMYGPDSSSSITFSEIQMLCKYKKFLAQAVKERQEPLQDYRILFSRSLGVSKELKAGTIIQEDDFVLKKPGSGIPPSKINLYIGRTLAKDVFPHNLCHPRILKHEKEDRSCLL